MTCAGHAIVTNSAADRAPPASSFQVVMSIKNLHTRCQSSFLTKSSGGNSSSKEKGGPMLQYLTTCLESMGRRIESLLETKAGHAAWLVRGGGGCDLACLCMCCVCARAHMRPLNTLLCVSNRQRAAW